MEDARYNNPMSSYNSDDEDAIKKRIAERKRVRKQAQMRKRRRIAICVALLLTLLAGWGIGRLTGSAVYKIGLKDPVSITADMPIVREAASQIGNKGGQPFWSWYGFEEWVDWCACFASWAENQCGYIESGAAPKFAMVGDGSAWFMERDQWKYGGETPDPGDLIFFNWDGSGSQDHVGIVTAVINDNVYTIEGNSSDRCRQKRYKIDDAVIYGYGQIKQ